MSFFGPGSGNVLVGGASVDNNATGVLAIQKGVPPTRGVPGTAQLYFVETGLISKIPVMTSNTSPSGVASASSIWSVARDAWNAFDGNTTTYWACGTSQFPAWVQYQFPYSTIINCYEILPYGSDGASVVYDPKNWVFQGSNNGSTWTDLDTQTNITSGWNSAVYRRFYIGNTQPYLYYRLYITANNGNIDMLIAEVKMYGGTTGVMAKFPDSTSLLLGGPGAPPAYYGPVGATGAPGANVRFKASLSPASAEFSGVSTEPTLQAVVGTNFNWVELQYADSSTTMAQWIIPKGSTDLYQNGTLSLDIFWTCTTNTGNVVWQMQMGSRAASATLDSALATARTITASAAPGTIGNIQQTTFTFTPLSTELVTNSIVIFKLSRLGADAGDTCTGVAKVFAMSLTEP